MTSLYCVKLDFIQLLRLRNSADIIVQAGRGGTLIKWWREKKRRSRHQLSSTPSQGKKMTFSPHLALIFVSSYCTTKTCHTSMSWWHPYFPNMTPGLSFVHVGHFTAVDCSHKNQVTVTFLLECGQRCLVCTTFFLFIFFCISVLITKTDAEYFIGPLDILFF